MAIASCIVYIAVAGCIFIHIGWMGIVRHLWVYSLTVLILTDNFFLAPFWIAIAERLFDPL